MTKKIKVREMRYEKKVAHKPRIMMLFQLKMIVTVVPIYRIEK